VRRLVLVGAAILLLSACLCAQLFGGKKGEAASGPRNLAGTVVDKSDHPVPNAIVYLKNMRSLAVLTFIAQDDGSYRFNNLSPSVDYEVRAESNGRKSAPKTLSSFDTRKQAHINLKLEK
jgi:protocatechuate 3,4-dioxygenase beta subunit